MISISSIFLILALFLAVAVPLLAVAIQLLRFINWAVFAEKPARGERPHFTGPVLALIFALLAAPDLLQISEFSGWYLIPFEARDHFRVAMLSLAALGWVYGRSIRNWMLGLFRQAKR